MTVSVYKNQSMKTRAKEVTAIIMKTKANKDRSITIKRLTSEAILRLMMENTNARRRSVTKT